MLLGRLISSKPDFFMEYIVDVIVVIKLYYLTEPPASINHHDWINTSI